MRRSRHISLLLVLLTMLVVGCTTVSTNTVADDPKLVVPECASAEEQFRYAKTFQGSMLVSSDAKRRREQLDRIIQCYEKVVTTFPNDTTFTPMAYLEIGDSVAHRGEFKRAITMYRAAISKWPDIEYVNARALLSIGRVQDGMGEFEEAKKTYAELRTKYGDSKSERVRGMVKAADAAYFKVREKK